MTHTYTVTGMTCQGCAAKVRTTLTGISGVKNVGIDLIKGEATIEMERHISTGTLRDALKDYPKYQLFEGQQAGAVSGDAAYPGTFTGPAAFVQPASPAGTSVTTSWLETYKPILLIFGYITLLSLIAATTNGIFSEATAMRVFMSGFFLTFSFFKLLDLKGFAESYAMYDIVAARFRYWGYVYAFIELALGIAFAINLQPFATNIVTLIVMAVSIIGVLQSVLSKRKIKCACLGPVFNLPMSTVTIIEDGLMIAMSCITLITI